LEAVYTKITGKAAAWGNTGGIGKGSRAELPNLIIVILLATGLVYSVCLFWVDGGNRLEDRLVVWTFGAYILSLYWPIVRTSIQEFFDYPYHSMFGLEKVSLCSLASLAHPARL